MSKTSSHPCAVPLIEICYLDVNRYRESIQLQWPLLSNPEKSKAFAYRFLIDRNRFILGRAALRRLLAQRLRANPKDLPLTENEFGKPMLKNSDLEFNVSHSGDLIALGLSSEGPIGIDIEHIRPIHDRNDLVEHNFDSNEKRQYFSAPEGTQNELFLNTFTQKEACLKNIGVGLSLPMPNVHTANLALSRSIVVVDHNSTLKNLQIHPLPHPLPANYVGALATIQHQISIRYISPEFIIG